MSDPKYNKYEGTVRFDDNNIVDIELQPDTENISVRLNGSEVTGGGSAVFYVDFSLVDPQAVEPIYQSNKTFSEILTAYNEGANVKGRFVTPSQITLYNLSSIYNFGESDKNIEFTNFGTFSDNTIMQQYINVNYDNSVTVNNTYIAFTE